MAKIQFSNNVQIAAKSCELPMFDISNLLASFGPGQEYTATQDCWVQNLSTDWSSHVYIVQGTNEVKAYYLYAQNGGEKAVSMFIRKGTIIKGGEGTSRVYGLL